MCGTGLFEHINVEFGVLDEGGISRFLSKCNEEFVLVTKERRICMFEDN